MRYVLVMQGDSVENQPNFATRGIVEIKLSPIITKLPNIKERRAYYFWPILAKDFPQRIYHINSISLTQESLILGLGNSFVISDPPEINFGQSPWVYVALKNLGFAEINTSLLLKVGGNNE